MGITFECELESENAAFDDGNAADECARIVGEIAERIRLGATHGIARDYNGNRVGTWSLQIDEPEEEDEIDSDEESDECDS
jgi:hypothetical protein